MSQKILAVVLMCLTCISAHGPPGVPPRQGGGPPAGMPQQQQQFNQQQPPQYQQQPPPPNHQQQPPPPNQQQQPPQQQPPQQQAYDPHANVVEGHGPDKAFKFQSEIHNADHILEHLQDTIKTKPREQMTEEELEFHYFKMHDYDNNNKLDGVEIGKALTHFHEEQDKDQSPGEDGQPAGEHPQNDKTNRRRPLLSDLDIQEMVDSVLEDDDLDGDGYVDVSEFLSAQRARGQEEPYHPDTV